MDAAPEASARIRDDPQRWADDVHTALLRQLTDPARQLPATGGRVHVVRSWTDVHDGHPVLHVVYRHPWWNFTTGLRRHLDEVENYPLNLPTPDVDPAVDLADDIATSDIEEPLGSVLESMAPARTECGGGAIRPCPPTSVDEDPPQEPPAGRDLDRADVRSSRSTGATGDGYNVTLMSTSKLIVETR